MPRIMFAEFCDFGPELRLGELMAQSLRIMGREQDAADVLIAPPMHLPGRSRLGSSIRAVSCPVGVWRPSGPAWPRPLSQSRVPKLTKWS